MSGSYLRDFSALEHQKTEMLVIGSGVAGLFAAYSAAEMGHEVTIITKNWLESNTRYAQGGIAAVLDHIKDSFDQHIADTLDAGGHLCDEDAVKIMVEEGPELVQKLIRLGTRFDRKDDGSLMVTREGGHSRYRVLHSDGDQTGREIVRSLQVAVSSHPHITTIDACFAIDLVSTGQECWGAHVRHEDGRYTIIEANATVIATGGLGQVYAHTTNPQVATADGMAMAYRAGAAMMNMAFVQFHPTALALKGYPSFLVSEAVRGEGAVLRNKAGKRFMLDNFARAELEPRDIVAKEMKRQMEMDATDHLYLDISPLVEKGIDFGERFPYIYKKLLEYGINPLDTYIPVAPAAHYAMGGIKTDLWGRSSISRLYVCGEAACSGLHGANRLASNSLLDGLVFSYRLAVDFDQQDKDYSPLPEFEYENNRSTPIFQASLVRSEVQKIMWDKVGLVRSETSLLQAVALLSRFTPFLWQELVSIEDYEVANLLEVALLICRSALWRRESRGSHYRSDYPSLNSTMAYYDVLRR